MSDDIAAIFALIDAQGLELRLHDKHFELGPSSQITERLVELIRIHHWEFHRELLIREQAFERRAEGLMPMAREALGPWWRYTHASEPTIRSFSPTPPQAGGNS